MFEAIFGERLFDLICVSQKHLQIIIYSYHKAFVDFEDNHYSVLDFHLEIGFREEKEGYIKSSSGVGSFKSTICCVRSRPSCSKLTTSLVNESLKFTSSDTQIC